MYGKLSARGASDRLLSAPVFGSMAYVITEKGFDRTTAFSLRRGAVEALLGNHVRHRPEDRRAEQAVGRAPGGELPVHHGGQDRELSARRILWRSPRQRSEEHTSELQSP